MNVAVPASAKPTFTLSDDQCARVAALLSSVRPMEKAT